MELVALGMFICYFAYFYPGSSSCLSSPGVLVNSCFTFKWLKKKPEEKMKAHLRGIRRNCIARVFLDTIFLPSQLFTVEDLALKNSSRDGQCLASVNLRANCHKHRLGVSFSGNCYRNSMYFMAFLGPSCTQSFETSVIVQLSTRIYSMAVSQRNTEGICGIT